MTWPVSCPPHAVRARVGQPLRPVVQPDSGGGVGAVGRGGTRAGPRRAALLRRRHVDGGQAVTPFIGSSHRLPFLPPPTPCSASIAASTSWCAGLVKDDREKSRSSALKTLPRCEKHQTLKWSVVRHNPRHWPAYARLAKLFRPNASAYPTICVLAGHEALKALEHRPALAALGPKVRSFQIVDLPVQNPHVLLHDARNVPMLALSAAGKLAARDATRGGAVLHAAARRARSHKIPFGGPR